jgi:gamma-glutamyltranspeptidase/glutathione hydrolase
MGTGSPTLAPGIAAGHPATAAAGIGTLEAGGSAADAAVCASLASCAAEVVMTGLAGGGHALWWDAASGRAFLLDFFVAVPGRGATRAAPELLRLEVPFGTELVHYAVGIGSAGVPGVPAGLGELWERHGRLPWAKLCEPAIAIARDGVPMPLAHALCLEMLAPVMTMREGEAIFAPGGELLREGGRLVQPELARAFELLAEEGSRAFAADGSLGRALLDLVEERGGLVTREDLDTYAPRWVAPLEGRYAGRRVLTRDGLAPLLPALAALPRLDAADAGGRALALVRALAGAPDVDGHTTNLVTADADGNACVVTTSLGLGSGDFLPGLQVHLNSMLGETDLLVGPLEPGARVPSMMAPTAIVDGDGLVLAAGSAGGTRIRSALVQSLSGILDEGLTPQDAVDRPRLHPVGRLVHLEPGFAPEAAEALAAEGWDVRAWEARHHYFGGVSLLGRAGGAADPRRSGAVLSLPA